MFIKETWTSIKISSDQLFNIFYGVQLILLRIYFLFILSLKFCLNLDKPAIASVIYISGLDIRKMNNLK